jgi:hypothetical protein
MSRDMPSSFFEDDLFSFYRLLGGEELALRRLAKVIEKTINVLERKAEKRAEQLKKRRSPNSLRDSFLGISAPESYFQFDKEDLYTIWQECEILADQLRYGFVVIVFSLLEERLNHICEELGKLMNGIAVSHEDMAGSGIRRALLYMNKVLGLDVPLHGKEAKEWGNVKEWQEIRVLQEIRNSIAHNAGKLGEEKKHQTVRKYAQQHPDYLEIDEQGRLHVRPAYYGHVLDRLERFFRLLYKKNNQRIEEFSRKHSQQGELGEFAEKLAAELEAPAKKV